MFYDRRAAKNFGQKTAKSIGMKPHGKKIAEKQKLLRKGVKKTFETKVFEITAAIVVGKSSDPAIGISGN